MTPSDNQPFPDFIKNFPLADVKGAAITCHLVKNPHGQVVFFELPAGQAIPPHRHGVQWGIVVQGEMELTIEGDTQICKRGDTYYIPDQAMHSARVRVDTHTVSAFADPDRYREKIG